MAMLLLALASVAAAYQPGPNHRAPASHAREALQRALASPASRSVAADAGGPALTTRRAASLSAALTAFAAVAAADASGGATAGGAYLLRAKSRYNGRVETGAVAYRAASSAVAADDAAALAALFAKDGAYEDLAASGFLLANAFRINSTQNPDKIPQVVKFKAFKVRACFGEAALGRRKSC
ncbi:hypothetical protein M885DRAFT_328619 [Pelagophyceae sp. CCMP2097]|nr:hypothetical protein M885DRAFT_328619 [Pelagophyceae sp. CCMP2097]